MNRLRSSDAVHQKPNETSTAWVFEEGLRWPGSGIARVTDPRARVGNHYFHFTAVVRRRMVVNFSNQRGILRDSVDCTLSTAAQSQALRQDYSSIPLREIIHLNWADERPLESDHHRFARQCVDFLEIVRYPQQPRFQACASGTRKPAKKIVRAVGLRDI